MKRFNIKDPNLLRKYFSATESKQLRKQLTWERTLPNDLFIPQKFESAVLNGWRLPFKSEIKKLKDPRYFTIDIAPSSKPIILQPLSTFSALSEKLGLTKKLKTEDSKTEDSETEKPVIKTQNNFIFINKTNNIIDAINKLNDDLTSDNLFKIIDDLNLVQYNIVDFVPIIDLLFQKNVDKNIIIEFIDKLKKKLQTNSIDNSSILNMISDDNISECNNILQKFKEIEDSKDVKELPNLFKLLNDSLDKKNILIDCDTILNLISNKFSFLEQTLNCQKIKNKKNDEEYEKLIKHCKDIKTAENVFFISVAFLIGYVFWMTGVTNLILTQTKPIISYILTSENIIFSNEKIKSMYNWFSYIGGIAVNNTQTIASTTPIIYGFRLFLSNNIPETIYKDFLYVYTQIQNIFYKFIPQVTFQKQKLLSKIANSDYDTDCKFYTYIDNLKYFYQYSDVITILYNCPKELRLDTDFILFIMNFVFLNILIAVMVYIAFPYQIKILTQMIGLILKTILSYSSKVVIIVLSSIRDFVLFCGKNMSPEIYNYVFDIFKYLGKYIEPYKDELVSKKN